jgi:hypothetical protein
MSGVAALKELVISKTVRLQHFTWQRSALMGAGLAYAWSTEKAWHTPLIVLMPSAYAGYQIYKNRQSVRDFISPSSLILTNPTHV